MLCPAAITDRVGGNSFLMEMAAKPLAELFCKLFRGKPSGTGYLEPAFWAWLSGTGYLAPAFWDWLSGTGPTQPA